MKAYECDLLSESRLINIWFSVHLSELALNVTVFLRVTSFTFKMSLSLSLFFFNVSSVSH